MQSSRIVSQEEWTAARRVLLAKEKAHMRAGDALAEERRALPWMKIEKPYAFDTEQGRKTLAELFGDHPQLIVHHLMFAPEWDAACPGCSFQAEHIDGPTPHLEHHNTGIVAVSRAPLAKLLAYRERMGWRFPWVSSFGSDFNRDFHVTFTPEEVAAKRTDYNYAESGFPMEEAPGISVFAKAADGTVFHTYSCYARGLDMLNGAYHLLDLTPKGRDEDELAHHMSWVRHHDRYED